MKNNSIPINTSLRFLFFLLLLFTIPYALYQWFIPSPIGYKETMLLLAIIFLFFSYHFIKRNKLDRKIIGFTPGMSLSNTILIGICGGVFAFITVISDILRLLLRLPYTVNY